MTNEQLERLCKEKEQGLLNKYYGNLVKEAAIERPEIIGEYIRILLLVMRENFLEEITGHHLENKAFDDN